MNDLDPSESTSLFWPGVFWRRWRAVLGSIAVCTGVVLAFTLTRQQIYQSETDVLLLTEASTGLFPFDQAIEPDLLRSASSELEIARSDEFRQAAAALLTFDADVELSLPEPERPDAAGSTLRITARDSSAQQAQTAAHNYADTYISLRADIDMSTASTRRDLLLDRIEQLSVERGELRSPIVEMRAQRQAASDRPETERIDREIADVVADIAGASAALDIQISEARLGIIDIDQAIGAFEGGAHAARVINAAPLARRPVSPNVPRNVIIGVVAGLLVGLLLAMIRERRDSGASIPAEVARAADTPYIGSIPELPRKVGAPGGVTPFQELRADEANSYAVLLNAATVGAGIDRIRSIAVIADRPRTGATQTAVNLAQAEAQRGTSVCIIDTSFASPGVATRLGLRDEGPGLADLLAKHAILDETIAPSDTPDLHVIGIGNVLQSTTAELQSTRLQVLVAALKERYGLVIIDIPPATGPVDARGAAASCDGVLVIYNATSSRISDIGQTVDALRSAGAVPLGLVSNRA